jgi:repressor LexA
MRTANQSLSKREAAALKFIREFSAEHKYPPTFRQIGQSIGVNSLSLVKFYIGNLEAKNMITREVGTARSLVVVE